MIKEPGCRGCEESTSGDCGMHGIRVQIVGDCGTGGKEKEWRLMEENNRLRAEIDHYQEREATVCPEDFSFEEVIESLRAEVERLRPKERVWPCGCVSCVCEDEVKCQGCGGNSCGQPGFPQEHTPGAKPYTIPGILAEALAARKFFDVSDIRKMGRLATKYLDARAANEEGKDVH